MKKVVLDTNVFVSGIFWNGPPSDLLELWQQHRITLCIIPDILEEYTRVSQILSERYKVDIEAFLELVMIYGEMFPNISLSAPISRDPDDDKFIACAISSQAKNIISGDKDLLDIGEYTNIKIVSPKQFLNNDF